MTHKIIGIGNAIVDFLSKSEDDFLKKLNVEKGSMSLIDENFVDNLSNLSIEKFSSGGSAGNTIATLAQLGNEAEFIGEAESIVEDDVELQELNSEEDPSPKRVCAPGGVSALPFNYSTTSANILEIPALQYEDNKNNDI